MIAQGFKIQWDGSVEYIHYDLAGLKPSSKIIPTIDFRVATETEEKKCVCYQVFEHSKWVGDTFLIRLKYDEANQVGKYVKENTLWGITEISFDPVSGACTANWTRDQPIDALLNNEIVEIDVIRKVQGLERTKVSRSVIVRPQQSELRQALLAIDMSCVLSGETQDEALEAAHILPVSENGDEVIDNTILLRADLHRLFDSGMFWFDINAEGACVQVSDKLTSDYYKTLLAGRKLSQLTFDRVAVFLKLRLDRTDGKRQTK